MGRARLRTDDLQGEGFVHQGLFPCIAIMLLSLTLAVGAMEFNVQNLAAEITQAMAFVVRNARCHVQAR